MRVCVTALQITMLAEVYLNVSTKYLDDKVKVLLSFIENNVTDTVKYVSLSCFATLSSHVLSPPPLPLPHPLPSLSFGLVSNYT